MRKYKRILKAIALATSLVIGAAVQASPVQVINSDTLEKVGYTTQVGGTCLPKNLCTISKCLGYESADCDVITSKYTEEQYTTYSDSVDAIINEFGLNVLELSYDDCLSEDMFKYILDCGRVVLMRVQTNKWDGFDNASDYEDSAGHAISIVGYVDINEETTLYYVLDTNYSLLYCYKYEQIAKAFDNDPFYVVNPNGSDNTAEFISGFSKFVE